MPSDHQWKPIEDLSPEWPALTDSELPAIRQVYEDLRALDPAATARWQVASHREWAIETGRVEDVYRWDRGTTETLMSKGIIADLIPRKGNDLEPEQIAAIIHDAQEVLEGLFEFVKGDRPLSKSYIHELHQALLKNVHTYRVTDDQGVVVEQKLEKGVYKRWPNSVKVGGGTHAYCPPEHVESEMDRLIEWHRRHVMDEVAPEVEAAWLHHRFTQIHPYPDGNGRVARALATLVLIKAGHFPLTIQTEKRQRYFDSLLTADRGNLSQFVDWIRYLQGNELVALSEGARPKEPPVSDVTNIEDAIRAIRQDLVSQGRRTPAAWDQVPDRVQKLAQKASIRVQEVMIRLRSELDLPDLNFDQIVSPVLEQYVELQLDRTSNPKSISFHFFAGRHLSSSIFRGIAQCEAFFSVENRVKRGADRFLITYAEPQTDQETRYATWLEAALLEGLKRWRETLKA